MKGATSRQSTDQFNTYYLQLTRARESIIHLLSFRRNPRWPTHSKRFMAQSKGAVHHYSPIAGAEEFAVTTCLFYVNRLAADALMRGQKECSGCLFSYVWSEERIPASHPPRRIRTLANQAVERLKPAICRPYALEGRPSVPPEQLHINLLFCWFVGLSPDDPIWHPTTFGLRPNSATPKTVIDSPMTTSSGCSLRR